MSDNTSVNAQVTDSITQVNVKVVGDAPAMAMGNLFQATAQALSNAAHNATTAQQQGNVTQQAATTQAIATLYAIDTASAGHATQQIYQLSKTPEHDALFMGNIALSDEDVSNLSNMKHLKYMHLTDVNVSDENLGKLKAALPSTEIYRETKNG